MPHKTLTTLWIVTGLAALSLLAATIYLAAKADTAGVARAEGVIQQASGTVYLYARPGASERILTVLEPGTPVTVSSEETRDGRIWFFVETQALAGWVLAASVRLAGGAGTK
jgi:hypothetical protein